MAWFKTKPAGTDSLKVSDDSIRANWTEVELRRLYNLVANAAFGWRSGGTSAVPDGWSLEGTPTVAYDTVDVGYGNYAVKLTASGATDEGIKQTLTNLKVSTKYQVFVRMKVTDGDTASLITTGATTNINEDSTSATWESITGEFVTDASATDVVLKLVASADGDVAYFCGITIVEGDIPPANFIRRIDEDNIGATTISAAQWGALGALVEWTDWTPTLTGGADLSGYTHARYFRLGNICFFEFSAVDKNVTTAGSIWVTLPFTHADTGTIACAAAVHNGTAWVGYTHVAIEANSDHLIIFKTAALGTWAGTETGVSLRISGFFEIA